MLLEKPEGVKHENSSGNACAIYGIDAHPTRPLFATAGGDNVVKIWSLTPQGDGIATFELLATLAFHQQAVNCVRWAAHGQYLASGSDDQLVLLYELQEGAPAPVPFGSNAQPNKENWVRCSTLKRHTMDVQDLAWSPDDRMMATCSIDNTILIWNVDSASIAPVMNQPLQTLSGHNGWVKGVAWDPVGKASRFCYLSSAGEDKTVRMWKVENWQTSDVISEPFESCASTSHFRRLSWSPDGSALCATHAFKSKKNIAALLNRTTWSNDVKFVGHQSVVTCARFNPKMLVTQNAPDKEFACCAVGGDDATVSIWLAHLARPLAVIKDCFDASVTDLSWSSGASILLACSLDGSICCFQFGGDEIGTPISDTRQSKLLQSKYGSRAGMTLASTLVENPIQLQLEQKSSIGAATVLLPKQKNPRPAASSQPVNILQPITKKSNKKRIAPVLQTTNGVLPPNNMPATSNPASSVNNIRNILGPNVSPTTPDVPLLDARMTGATSNESVKQDIEKKSASAKPVVANGEKLETAIVKTNGASVVEKEPSSSHIVEVKKNPEASLKRKREADRAPSLNTTVSAPPTKSRDISSRPPKLLNQSETGVANGGQLLPEFPFRLAFSEEVDMNGGAGVRYGLNPTTSVKYVVEVSVHNMKHPQSEEIIEVRPVFSTIKCSEATTVKWIDRVPGRVVAVVGNASFCAVGMDNGDLYLLSTSGRRLFPCISLGSALSVMECSPRQSPYMLVILASGELRIWNVLERKQILSDTIEAITYLHHGDTRHLTLLRCQVTVSGQPIITFAKANKDSKRASSLLSFTFDASMSCWMRVADDSFVFSDFNSALPTDTVAINEIPIGPLRKLQNASGYSRTQRGIASVMLSGMSDPLMQRNITRSHLEHQIAAAIALKSTAEYRYWIQTYVKFLAQDEDVGRLEDLCAEMMGPFHAPTTLLPPTTDITASRTPENGWNPTILSLTKRNLLKTLILPTMATNRSLQRVVTKYQLMLSEIASREQEDEVIEAE